MVPNYTFSFFFTIDETLVLSKAHKIEFQKKLTQTVVVRKSEGHQIYKIKSFNKLNKSAIHQLFKPNSYNLINEVESNELLQPRLVIPDKPRSVMQNNWDISTSIFRQFPTENQNQLQKCFDYDFNTSTISRKCKNNSEVL